MLRLETPNEISACSDGCSSGRVFSVNGGIERAGKRVPASFGIPVKRVVAYSGGDSLAVTMR